MSTAPERTYTMQLQPCGSGSSCCVPEPASVTRDAGAVRQVAHPHPTLLQLERRILAHAHWHLPVPFHLDHRVARTEQLYSWRLHLGFGRQVEPDLVELVLAAFALQIPHLLVEHTAASCHPLDGAVAVSHLAAERVSMRKAVASRQHVCDSLKSPVRVGREALREHKRGKERPERVERTKGVPMVDEEDEGVGLGLLQ
eukprot:scaffold74833_cov39-Tisochrysis_lutea.AAC.1